MQNMIYAAAILGGIGLLFGLMLALASRIFNAEADDRIPLVSEALPGVNCGGCGKSGCAAFAAAVVEGGAPVNGCPVGGESTTKELARIMGLEVLESVRTSAYVRCSGGTRAHRKYAYDGLLDCFSATRLNGGPLECGYGCVGLGECVNACRFGAIRLDGGVAVVDREDCTACGMCVSACPRGLIEMIPYGSACAVSCVSKDRGNITRGACEAGCVGCGLCEKACGTDAVHVVDNMSLIEYNKCTDCGVCIAACPRKTIKPL